MYGNREYQVEIASTLRRSLILIHPKGVMGTRSLAGDFLRHRPGRRRKTRGQMERVTGGPIDITSRGKTSLRSVTRLTMSAELIPELIWSRISGRPYTKPIPERGPSRTTAVIFSNAYLTGSFNDIRFKYGPLNK